MTIRAPLLLIETFLALSDQGLFPTEAGSATQGAVAFETDSLVPQDARLQLALAVGSQSLFQALSRSVVKARRDRDRRSTLLRYLIRMSTRPTRANVRSVCRRGGAEAMAALERAAQVEAQRQPKVLWAELTYHPASFRSANVAIRPWVRLYEQPLRMISPALDK